jgi:hypothetical protein
MLVFALAIFVMLSAEGFWVGWASRADDCITQPGAAPPQGSHWYYHSDRANNRQCWYLAAESAKVRPQTRQAPSPVSQNPKPNARSQQSADAVPLYVSMSAKPAPAQPASVEMTVGRLGVDENESMTVSARQWSSLPAPAVANEPDLISTTRGSAADQSNETPSISPVLPPVEPLEVEPFPNSAISPTPLSAAFVAVLGFDAMVIGVAFGLLTLRKRSPSHAQSRLTCPSNAPRRGKQATSTFANTAASAGPNQMSRKRVKIPPSPSSPVADIEANLRRLLQELQRREYEPLWQGFDRTLVKSTA